MFNRAAGTQSRKIYSATRQFLKAGAHHTIQRKRIPRFGADIELKQLWLSVEKCNEVFIHVDITDQRAQLRYFGTGGIRIVLFQDVLEGGHMCPRRQISEVFEILEPDAVVMVPEDRVEDGFQPISFSRELDQSASSDGGEDACSEVFVEFRWFGNRDAAVEVHFGFMTEYA